VRTDVQDAGASLQLQVVRDHGSPPAPGEPAPDAIRATAPMPV
jgi:hypothetical protein